MLKNIIKPFTAGWQTFPEQKLPAVSALRPPAEGAPLETFYTVVYFTANTI